MPELIKALPPPPVDQGALQGDSTKFAPSWSSWFFLLRQALNTAPIGSGTQSAIQFKHNGANIGAIGAITSIDFVGDVNNLSIVGTDLTVTAQQMSLSQLLAFSAAQG